MVITAVVLYIAMTGAWVVLASSMWNLWVLVLSTAPLILVLVLMSRRRPVVYFYAALLAMPYLATAITQVMISAQARLAAALCLGCGLAYLAILAAVLRTLNRLPQDSPA